MLRQLGPVVFGVAIAACGGSSSNTPDAPPSDTTPSPDATLHAVTVASEGTVPDLYEFRDGSGVWQPVDAPDANGESVIHVANDYAVLAVCAGAGDAFFAAEAYATVGDAEQFVDCFESKETTIPPDFAVTGTMAQAGTVFLGTSDTGTTSPWDFSVQIAAGTYDLGAFDTAETKLLIHRGIAIAGAETLPGTLDLGSDGVAIPTVTPTITGAAAGSTLSIDSQLFTVGGSLIDLGGKAGGAIPLTPPSLVLSTDLQEVTVVEEISLSQQSATLVGAAPGDITLPDTLAMLAPLTGITFPPDTHTVAAHWTTLPAITDGTVNVFVGNTQQTQTTTATPAWLALHDQTSLEFDTTADHYKAIWYIDPTQGYFDSLSVFNLDDTSFVDYESSLTDPASTGVASLRSSARAAESSRRRHRLSRRSTGR